MFIKQFPEGVYVRDKKNIKQCCFKYDITCIIHTTNTIANYNIFPSVKHYAMYVLICQGKTEKLQFLGNIVK